MISVGNEQGMRRWTPPRFMGAIRDGVRSGVLAGGKNGGADKDNPITGKDPAFDVMGMAPNYAQYMLPHVTSFQGLFGTFSRIYRVSDEALADSWENARYMRNDVGVMECIEARERAVALLPWHLEPEDEKSHEQEQLAAAVERILKRVSRFTEYRRNLLMATWFGRFAVQHRFGWVNIGGREYCMPAKLRDDPGWKPIHGDKLVWRYDDGTGKFLTDQVGIRVGQKHGAGSKINKRWTVEATDRGMAYFMADWERPLVSIHRHQIEDGAFENPQDAGMVHGVGIRHRIYWEWFQKQESLAFLMEYLERSAGGIEVHYYPEGNEAARLAAEHAVKSRMANGRNVMLYPRPAGEDSMQYGVEFINPDMAGIEALKSLLTDYFGHRIKRYILGQTLSSEAAATGLGSGVADFQYDTLQQIIKYDAVNLEETISDDLVKTIQHWNFPASKGIHLRFAIDVEADDVKDSLEAMKSAWEMGAKLSAREVMDKIGASVPDSGEDVLQNPQMAQQPAGNMAQGFGPGMPGGDPNAAPVEPYTADSMRDELTRYMFGDPGNAKNGEITYVTEGGKWVQRKVPDFDTGERVPTDRFRKILARYRKRWEEAEHPRASDGKFADAAGQSRTVQKKTPPATSAPLEGSKGIPRHEMPQITKEHLPSFLESLEKNGVPFEEKSVPVGDLKPTQKEINPEKVASMRARYKTGGLGAAPPVLASSDGYILDGHHRWAALKEEDPTQSMDIVEVGMPIDELLTEAENFDSVGYSGVNDSAPVETPKAQPSKARLSNFDEKAAAFFEHHFPTLKAEHLASLIGAPDDAEIEISYELDQDVRLEPRSADDPGQEISSYNTIRKDRAFVWLRMENADMDAIRCLKSAVEGDPVWNRMEMQNREILVKTPGKGLGTTVFAKQVEFARQFGVSKIECDATNRPAGSLLGHDVPQMFGHKVWPRLGYDGPIANGVKAALGKPDTVASAVKEKFGDDVDTIQKLFRKPGGRKWWDENGDTIHVEFDTAPDSQSSKILDRYLRKKRAAGVIPEKYARQESPEADGDEAPDLSPEEWKILEELWDEIEGDGDGPGASPAEGDEPPDDAPDDDTVEKMNRAFAARGLGVARYREAKGVTGKERWITIGGGESGHGTHVKIQGDKIVSGPAALQGKLLAELSSGDKEKPKLDPEATIRANKEDWPERAPASGSFKGKAWSELDRGEMLEALKAGQEIPARIASKHPGIVHEHNQWKRGQGQERVTEQVKDSGEPAAKTVYPEGKRKSAIDEDDEAGVAALDGDDSKMQAVEHKNNEQARANIKKAADATAVRLAKPGSRLQFLVGPSPAADEKGKWRLWTVDNDMGRQPVGHAIFNSRESAIKSASGVNTPEHGRPEGDRDYEVVETRSEPFKLKSEPGTKERNPKLRQPQLLDPETAEPLEGRLPGAAKDLNGLHKTKDGRWVGATQINVSQMFADPKRFQYKISNIDAATGVTTELKEVKQYNPEFGGQLLVWHDQEDGKTYVVNGHHRFELASRSPHSADWHGEMPVYFVNAKNAAEARARGAMANMAEGRGTAVDAAKFLRDSGRTAEDLKSSGISLKGKVASDGTTLAKLADPIFQKLTNGQVTESRALAIAGELGDDHDLQNELWKELGAIEGKKGKEIPDAVVREMAREYKDVPVTSKTVKSLFGDNEERQSLMLERNTLKSEVRKALGEERAAFKAVAGETGSKRQGTLERGGINRIDVDRSREELKRAEGDFDTFDRLVNYKGPISDAVNEAAKELSDAPKRKKSIVNRLAERIRELSKDDPGTMGFGGGGSEGHSGTGDVGGGEGGATQRIAASPEPFGREFARVVARYRLTGSEARAIVSRYAKSQRA